MSKDDIVILNDENGAEIRFLHIMTFDYRESFYAAVTPEVEVEGIKNGEVLLLEIREDENGGDVYLPIETEKELQEVWEAFEERYYEESEDDE